MARRAAKQCQRCQRPTRAGKYCEDCRPAVPTAKRRDDHRPSAAARGYDHAWQVARENYLAEPGNQVCRICRSAIATVVDHITPHRGDRRLFWDRKKWQPLCKRCHDRKTAGGS